MTTGALIFARNNEQIDYEAMACWSAKNIERHLGIPTHIVTDNAVNTNTRHLHGKTGTKESNRPSTGRRLPNLPHGGGHR